MLLLKRSIDRFTSLFTLLLLLAIMSLVQSCGFQLRGALDISQDISPLYLKAKSAFDLAREIKQLLASNKIEVTDKVNKANSQLILLDEKKGRRVLSVDSNGRVREYLLTYTVNFQVLLEDDLRSSETNNNATALQLSANQNTDEDDNEDDGQDTITVKRTLLFDQNAVLAVTNESEILYKDMRRDTARLILLKVKAHSSKNEKTRVAPVTIYN